MPVERVRCHPGGLLYEGRSPTRMSGTPGCIDDMDLTQADRLHQSPSTYLCVGRAPLSKSANAVHVRRSDDPLAALPWPHRIWHWLDDRIGCGSSKAGRRQRCRERSRLWRACGCWWEWRAHC